MKDFQLIKNHKTYKTYNELLTEADKDLIKEREKEIDNDPKIKRKVVYRC